MTKPSRRALLVFLVAVFFIAGVGAVLYAQGYRLDTITFRITKVGGVFVRSFPKDADIRLDGEPFENQSGLFGSGTLIGALFPGSYDISLSKDGYRPWRRSVTVLSSLVADVKFAVLVPETPTVITASSAASFWVIGDNVLTKTIGDDLLWGNKRLPGNEVLGDTNDGTRLLTWSATRRAYFWTDLETGSSTNVSALVALGGATPVVDPTNSSKLLLAGSSSLAVADLQRNTVTPVAKGTLGRLVRPVADAAHLAWGVFDRTARATTVFFYDKDSGTTTRLGEPLTGEPRELRFENGVLGILQDTGDFFVVRPGSAAAERKATEVTGFSIGADGMQAAIVESRGLAVFSLRGDGMYTRFNLRDAHEITALTWYHDGRHLFLQYPDRIAFLDLDDLSLENVTEVSRATAHVYDSAKNNLYVLDAGVRSFLFPK